MENIKRAVLITLICLIPFLCHAVKMTDFTEETSPDTADLLWLTVDVSTTAADRKVTLGNLLLWMATQDITFSGTLTLPASTTLTTPNLDTPTITLADDSTLTLPAAAPEVPSFFHIATDGTMTFVPISDYGGIPSYGDLTTEHVAVWYNDDGTWKLKAGDLPATDNTTNGKLVKKVVDGGVHTLEDAEAGVDYAAPNADTTGTASKLPVDTATDASGEESVDSTTGQYRNYDGTRQNVFSPINSFSIVIPAPADTDDINILKAPYGMTILGIDCIVQGTTSVTGQIQECSSAGASCADLDSDITCDADGAADDGTLTDSTIASGAWLRWKTTSVSGTPTFLTVTVRYSVVAD